MIQRITQQKGWISLPIIALLLAVSTLSSHYQETVLASYKWRGQLQDIDQEHKIWEAFKSEFVTSVDFSTAKPSDCLGFCDVSAGQNTDNEHTWYSSDESLYYQWNLYEEVTKEVAEEAIEEEGENRVQSYRLCASQYQQGYYCWWWRDNKLLSDGWVSLAD